MMGGHTMPKPKYEGTARDRREDAKGAREMGLSQAAYEKTARDRREDRAGQQRLQQQPSRKGKK